MSNTSKDKPSPMYPRTLNGLKEGLEHIARMQECNLAMAVNPKDESYSFLFEFSEPGLAVMVDLACLSAPFEINLFLTPHFKDNPAYQLDQTMLLDLMPDIWNPTYNVGLALLRVELLFAYLSATDRNSSCSVIDKAVCADHDWAW